MVTVRFSKRDELILPESLGRFLGLREGDRVEVQRQDNILWFRRGDAVPSSSPLTDLSRIVSSSLPVGSVDVERYMNRHGYEQMYVRSDL
jgi:hypothetical protein